MKLKSIDECSFYTFEALKTKNYFFIKPLNFANNVDRGDLKKNIATVEKMIDTKLSFVNQQHTDIIKKVTLDNYKEKIIADGMVTDVPEIALATTVADCQAIFLHDEKKKVIGNVHSGWRGTVSKIVGNAINVMVSEYGSNISDIQVFISPSIGKCHFEVDEDVYMLFKESFNDIDVDRYVTKNGEKNKYYIDTFELNKKYLISKGLLENNIYLSDICTVCEGDTIHSYRNEKENSGRNLAVISL